MKVAVCVSGQQRSSSFSRKEHDDSMKRAFKNVDAEYFYHTWDSGVLYRYDNMIVEKEPKMDYHPIYDTKAYGGPLLEQRRLVKKDEEKMLNASKQILAHSSLLKTLTKTYDVVIRCRWDLYFSDQFDYTAIIKKSYEDGPVGMGYPKMDLHYLHNAVPQERNKNNIRWVKMFSPDNLIFHRHDLWNTELVDRLHKEKNLLPCEWGWYQILCEPFGDHHYTYRGGVICTAGVVGGWRPNKR